MSVEFREAAPGRGRAASAPTPRGRRTRDAMVAAAAELMRARGIAATGLGDVLAATGTGKSQLYHHFGDKRGLVVAVIDHQLDRVLAFQAALAPDGDVAAWARGVLDAHSGPEGPLSCPLGVLSGQVDDDPVLRAHQAAAFDRWREALAAMVTRGRVRGLVPEAPGRDDAGDVLLTALQGGMMLARVARDVGPLETALTTALTVLGVHADGSSRRSVPDSV